jgi:RDD family
VGSAGRLARVDRPGATPTAADLLLGIGATAFGLARWTFRAATRTVTTVYPPAGRLASVAAERARADLELVVRQAVVKVLGVALATIDLTKLIRENVDLDAVAQDLDVDAVVERLDVAAVARQVLDEIDLPEIVRESSGVLSSEVVGGVRVRAIRADAALTRGGTPQREEPAEQAERRRPAGAVTRLLGAILDAGLVALLSSLLYLGVAGLRLMWWPASFSWPHPPVLVSVTVVVLVAVVYLTSGWVTTGRSLGGSLLGYRVLSLRREPLGWPRAAARAVLYVVFPIGLALAALTPARLSLQDMLLRSTVVYDWHR